MDSTLIFFSGGKDSFISTCRMVEKGNVARLITFNNGALIGEENVKDTIDRLKSKYGVSHIKYEGACYINGINNSLRKKFNTMPIINMSDDIRHARINQINCMFCQTSMWIAGISYALAKGIGSICAGYRPSDLFCTGTTVWVEAMTDLAKRNGIDVFLPLWDCPVTASSDFERDIEMSDRGFVPKLLEPQCTIGLPGNSMSKEEVNAMRRLYEDFIESRAPELIQHMRVVYFTTELNSESTL